MEAIIAAGRNVVDWLGATVRLLRRHWALLLGLSASLPLMLLTLLLALDRWISWSAGGAVTASLEAIEPVPVALVLGTANTHQGRPNQYYQARIEAASALFHAGRVRGLLLSGDNATIHYNEPQTMRRDLLARGVPDAALTLDYAGFRTLDSVVRAREVFGLERVLVVSQRFHAERAVFLARHFGLTATGFAADNPTAPGPMRVRFREVFARAAAILDILTRRAPRFLGPPETLNLIAAPDTRASTAAVLTD